MYGQSKKSLWLTSGTIGCFLILFGLCVVPVEKLSLHSHVTRRPTVLMGKKYFSDPEINLPPQLANLPGVRRADDSILEVLKRKADEVGNAFKPKIIKPALGEVEPEPIVPQFVLKAIEKLPRTSAEWLTIGAVVVGALLVGYAARLIYRMLKYRWQANNIQRAFTLIDAAHARDPIPHDLTLRPRELVFCERATGWLNLLCPQAGPELRLAVRAHRLENWKPRKEQRRVGEFLKQAELSYFIAPVNFILERRGEVTDYKHVAFQDTVALTNIDGYVESFVAGLGPEEDVFLAMFAREWKELSDPARELCTRVLVNPLAGPLKEKVLEQIRKVKNSESLVAA